MLTPHEIQIIKQSWNLFLSINPSIVGNAFYGKLFFDRPELRKMFPHKMDAQYVKLLQMLSTIVMRLERLDELTNEILALAKRHQGYGVKAEHYKFVGEALVWTLKTGMGREWNKELESAWIKCFQTISNAMITGANEKSF
jgi:nitric oxide dioxygenase